MKKIFIYCLSLFFNQLLTESASAQQSIAQNENYRLVKVDSLMVPVLEPLHIMDYNPETKKFLGYGIKTKALMEVDLKGRISNNIDLRGEGPGRFGQGIARAGYFGNGKILEIMGAYFIYDKDWNYQYKLTYSSGGAYYPVGYLMGDVKSTYVDEKLNILKIIDNSELGHFALPRNYFQKAKLIELNSKDEKPEQILDYPANSIYRSDTYFMNYTPTISLNEDGKRLYLTFPYEPNVYIYDVLNHFAPLEEVKLDLKDFNEPQGIPFSEQRKNLLKGYSNSQNELNFVYSRTNSYLFRLSVFGDVMIVGHRTNTKGETSITSVQEAEAFGKRNNTDYHTFFYKGREVLRAEGNFVYLVRISESKFLTHQINNDVELDYNLFYIYELQKVGN